jgi:hypothetical protein
VARLTAQHRNWLVVALAAAIVIAFVVMFLTVKVCEDQMATTGDNPGPFAVCRHISITDPPVVALGAALVALIGIFYTEVSGFGITLKRTVNEAKTAAEKAGNQAEAAHDAVSTLNLQISSMRNELQQISTLRANQSLTLNLTGGELGAPRHTKSTEDNARDPATSNALEQLRMQDAFHRFGLREAYEITRKNMSRGVRTAIVGPAPDISVMAFPAFRDQIEQPFIGVDANIGSMYHIGDAIVGHILALEPAATIYPVSILDSNNSVNARSLTEGMVAALRWIPMCFS